MKKLQKNPLLERRLFVPLILVVLIGVIGTVGYYLLGREQGASWLDALYMTVITLTTVGYREVIEPTNAAKIFTIFISVTGIGTLFFMWGELMDFFLSRRLADPKGERKMRDEIERLSNHIVVVGLGRVGRQAVNELIESKTRFVVIDSSEESARFAAEKNLLFIAGDATDDEVLGRAGISRACGMIVTTGSDASNLYVVLSARTLNPNLYIVSRAVDEGSVPKLTRAGANRAISPHAIGGRRLAHLILSPTVVDFFDTAMKKGEENLNIEDLKIKTGSKAIGLSIKALQVREKSGASVLVILRGSQIFPNPTSHLIVQDGDRFLALGTMKQLEILSQMIS